MALEAALAAALDGPLAVTSDGGGIRLGGPEGLLLRPLGEGEAEVEAG
jgi:hypothetical protein